VVVSVGVDTPSKNLNAGVVPVVNDDVLKNDEPLTVKLSVGVSVPTPNLLFTTSTVTPLVEPKYTFPSSNGFIFNGEQEWIFDVYKSVIQFPEPPLKVDPLKIGINCCNSALYDDP
jgi:hypothetical protein